MAIKARYCTHCKALLFEWLREITRYDEDHMVVEDEEGCAVANSSSTQEIDITKEKCIHCAEEVTLINVPHDIYRAMYNTTMEDYGQSYAVNLQEENLASLPEKEIGHAIFEALI